MLRIAVLGLGEAGSAIAADLVAAGADVRGFDPVVTPGPGVASRRSETDAVRDAELVLSLNSAADALDAARQAASALPAGAIWADLNTASPTLKRSLLPIFDGLDVGVVDVALLAPVPGRGLRTPMLAAGPAAVKYAHLLGGFGARVEIQPGPLGAAISRKLLRSVFSKGVAAAVVEALAGAEVAGCGDWMWDNIKSELVAFDASTIDRLVEGSRRHARRRAEEMAAASDQLIELGVEPRIAAAARDLLIDLRDREDVQ